MKKSILALSLLALFTACDKKNKIEDLDILPSEGSTIQLSGLAGSEAGSAAGNMVFVDFSKDEQTAVLRKAWDLGFSPVQSRVIINYATGAAAFVTNKSDLNSVNASDTAGIRVALSAHAPEVADFDLIDDVHGDINKTVIPQVSSNEADNKVIILNRGTAGSIEPRDYYKIKIVKSATGYTLHYAPLDATSFNTINITSDKDYNFQFFSFEKGLVNIESKKANWDIQWTLSVYETSFGSGNVPYTFSDLVAINHHNKVKVAIKTFDNETLAKKAYDEYTNKNLSGETFSTDRWTIGSTWRRTAAPGATDPAGTLKNKFYIIQDVEGNAYKVKFLSFTSEDGGTRGKPEIKYELIK